MARGVESAVPHEKVSCLKTLAAALSRIHSKIGKEAGLRTDTR